MKKFLWILALGLFLSACGKDADKAIDQAKEVEKVSDQDSLTEDDLFFSDFNLVSVMDGEVVSIISDMKNLGDDTYAYPVPLSDDLFVFATGFRVIIVIEANSYVNIRSSRLLPKFKTQKINSWCAA